MTNRWATSATTASMSMPSCDSVRSRPVATMSLVASVGACGMSSQAINDSVSAKATISAPTRAALTFSRLGDACVRPKTTSAKQPARTPIKRRQKHGLDLIERAKEPTLRFVARHGG